MADLQRQRVVWTGFPGAPGLSTFYFADAAASQSALTTFLNAIKGLLPPDVTLTIEPGGDVLNDANGVLTASWAGTLQTPVSGTGGAPHAGPAGMITRWETATIRAGSRLRGRTYLVPTTADVFDNPGNILPSQVSILAAASSTFVGAVTPNLLVWQRPRLARTAYTDGHGHVHKALAARDGSSAVVISSSVPNIAAVLRSRRD